MDPKQLEGRHQVSKSEDIGWSRHTNRFGWAPALELRDLLGVLRRRKWVLITCAVLITGATTAVVYSLTPQYDATTSVMLDAREPRMPDIGALITGAGVGRETIESQVAIILSGDMAERTARRLRLYENPEFNPTLREPAPWRIYAQAYADEAGRFFERGMEAVTGPRPTRPPAVEEEFERERRQIMDTLLSKIRVEPRPGSWVLEITARSQSPSMAAQLANTVADFYLVDQLDAKYEAAKRVNEWLTERLSNLQRDLERSENAVEEYRSSAGLLRGMQNVTLAQQQISDVNSRMVAASQRRTEVEARLAQAEALLRSPGGAGAAAEVLQSPIVQQLVGEYTRAQREVAQLSVSVGQSHPTMVSARAQLGQVQAQLTTEINKVVDSLRSELSVARSQENELEQNLARLEGRVSELNTREAQLRVLEQESATNRFLYETFLSNLREQAGQEDIQLPDARIISRAEMPLRAAFPNKPIFIALGAISSLLIGLVIIGLMEHFSRGLRSMEEVYREFGLRCIGLVPAINRFRLKWRAPADYVVSQPRSAYAEAVRAVRAGVILPNSNKKPRVIVITSARPRESKTSISVSLARLNAMEKSRTILVDFDLRKPDVHKSLRTRMKAGVADCLRGEADLQDVIQRDRATGLEYVLAGHRTPETAGVWRLDRLEAMLRELRQNYDLVVLDAPPVLAVSDTRLLAQLADTTVMVVRWGETRKDMVRLALQQLADVGVEVAGIVISMVDINRNTQYGYADSDAFTGAYRRYYQG